jgi:hypothetical protein
VVIESSQSILGGTDPLSLRSPHFHFRRGGQPPPSPRQRGLHNNDRRSPPPAPCRTWSHVSQGSACAAGAVGHGGRCWCKFGTEGGHPHHSTLVLRRGREPKGPFGGLLVLLLLLPLSLLLPLPLQSRK